MASSQRGPRWACQQRSLSCWAGRNPVTSTTSLLQLPVRQPLHPSEHSSPPTSPLDGLLLPFPSRPVCRVSPSGGALQPPRTPRTPRRPASEKAAQPRRAPPPRTPPSPRASKPPPSLPSLPPAGRHPRRRRASKAARAGQHTRTQPTAFSLAATPAMELAFPGHPPPADAPTRQQRQAAMAFSPGRPAAAAPAAAAAAVLFPPPPPPAGSSSTAIQASSSSSNRSPPKRSVPPSPSAPRFDFLARARAPTTEGRASERVPRAREQGPKHASVRRRRRRLGPSFGPARPGPSVSLSGAGILLSPNSTRDAREAFGWLVVPRARGRHRARGRKRAWAGVGRQERRRCSSSSSAAAAAAAGGREEGVSKQAPRVQGKTRGIAQGPG